MNFPDIECSNSEIASRILDKNVSFIVDMFSSFIQIFDGDATSTLIFFTIFQFSTARNDIGVSKMACDANCTPDSLHRTVSILRISEHLGLPYETTRRHVLKLVAKGYCVRKGTQEFLISSEILSRQEFVDLSLHTFDLTKTYIKKIRPYLAVCNNSPEGVPSIQPKIFASSAARR